MSCFDLAHAPVATTARAAATGPVSMSTRPDPEGSDTVEIATRRCPRLRVVWDLRELTHKQKPRLWSLPARLGPVTVHPTRWGVGHSLFMLGETWSQKQQDGSSCWLRTIIHICFAHFLFIFSFRLWGILWVEESVQLISQSYRKRLPWT